MLSLIIFILILGVIVTVHEFGHFIFAKLSNTYVYEFSIGMGKKLFGKKRKDGETEFCIRAVPIGGYVMIAGEDLEDEKIPKDRQMCNKSFLQRFMVLFAGAFNNFIFAFIILFISAIIYGAAITKPYIGDVSPDYPAYTAGLEKGDLLLSLNGTKITNWDKALVMLQTSKGNEMTFKVLKQDGSTKEYKVAPIKEKDSEGNESYKFGIATKYEKEYGFTKSLSYAWNKTISLFGSMWDTLKYLFNGKVSINQLSGPVGIYSVVDSQSHQGMEALLYLVAYLSINVGIINLLPFPAFDGGRILFLFIEKIFRKPVSKNVENIIHSIGFMLIIGLLIYVTFNDIIKLF
ncbi:MAG: RIP metalloprotease RseP [Erysipelotrichaceae bacterium]|nr:RIP metalloprotease RseP [Erysipelotrichaceae bacterium]